MFRSLLLIFTFLIGILSFSGCGGPAYKYTAYSNVGQAQVYCGYDKNNLKYCFNTPYYKATNTSQGWSNKYFQARKTGYQDTAIVKHPLTHNNASLYFNLEKDVNYKDIRTTPNAKLTLDEAVQLNKYTRKDFNGKVETLKPQNQNDTFLMVNAQNNDTTSTSENYSESYKNVKIISEKGFTYTPFNYSYSYKRESGTVFKWLFIVPKDETKFKLIIDMNNAFDISVTSLKEKVDTFIKNQDIKGLQILVEKQPEALDYIPSIQLKLALTGPKSLRVYDVKELVKKGMSEVLIISQIKRVKTPYKEFTLEEIEALQKMGLSDNIIASMIDVTTKLNDQKRADEKQIKYLQMQQNIAKTNTQKEIIYKNAPQTNYSNNNASNDITNKLQDKLMEEGAKRLFDHFFK